MKVPFIDLSRSIAPEVIDQVIEDWRDCLTHASFVQGPRVVRFEEEVSRHLDAPPMIACGNGTDALVIALHALGIGPGHRVALPDLTFWATYEAPVARGARPVLIDVDAHFQLDLDELRAAHEEQRIDAVILPHLFGWCSPRAREIRAFCRAEGIALIEDSAQAFGVRYEGRSIFDTDVSTLSFYPAKVLGGASDGGGMFFRDVERASLARALSNHGRTAHYAFGRTGWSSRMSGPNAAFLSRMLARVDSMIASRRAALERYATNLASLSEPGVTLHLPPDGVEGNGYLCVLTLEDRAPDELAAALGARGIGSARTYPSPIGAQPGAQDGFDAVTDRPRARAFCERVLNLPLFAGITDDEVDASVDALAAALHA
ncbi:MAG: DegT/DnrJ/EryC1/StrS family aminotransferase [Sandaracinaceae bacterium]